MSTHNIGLGREQMDLGCHYYLLFMVKLFPKQQILDPSKLQDSEDNNIIKLMKMAGSYPKG